MMFLQVSCMKFEFGEIQRFSRWAEKAGESNKKIVFCVTNQDMIIHLM